LGRVGEGVDAALVHLDPVRDADLLTDQAGEGGGRDGGLCVHVQAFGSKRSSMIALNRAASILPPDRTTAVVRSRVSILPARTAASDTAPPGSTTSFSTDQA